nr:TetR/AcrR family transcriptional regulator C-terminal domain-containing protein [uncultured Actinoplanes sp.]
MTTDFSGAGDPRRSIELLWRVPPERPRRGPKPRFTVDEVAAAAIAIADEAGLSGLSMRRVAERLGVQAMALYTYVPGKAELIDLMLDTVCAEAMPASVPEGWRARLELVARSNLDLYLRHPWMLEVATARPPLGPHLLAKYDYELRAVDGVGLSDIEMDLVVQMVADYVHGAARAAVGSVLVAQRTGLSDEQWWELAAPALEKVFDPASIPTATRVGAAAGEEYQAAADPGRAFAFGLQRLLDGVDALISRRAAG